MSSLLSFQLSQQQKKQSSGLPSPPNSFCGEENNKATRRDSLQTVFNDMTIKDYSVSLPDNYTIDHSIAKKRNTIVPTITAAATGGLTVRSRRPSEININRRKSSNNIRTLSKSFNDQHRCDDCGKSYKSQNCLQKHRWEHSEEWELTKKLPLTKHQQVQMLEAAAILIGMAPKEQEEEDIEIDIDKDSEEEESIVIDDDDDTISITSNDDSTGLFVQDL